MKNKITLMRLMYLILVALLVSGCTTESKKEKAFEAEGTTEKPKEEIEVKKENFDNFFKRFSEDSNFQFTRINFPISYFAIDIEDNKEEYVYSREDFWFTDFSKDNDAITQETDKYEPIIKERSDTETTYIRMGIDNGIRIEYYFEVDPDGKWQMIKIIDNSI